MRLRRRQPQSPLYPEDRRILIFDSLGLVHEIHPHFATPGGQSSFPLPGGSRIRIEIRPVDHEAEQIHPVPVTWPN